MQLYQPLGFFGFVYRALKQSLIDIENMLELLDVPQDVDDVPDAPASPAEIEETARLARIHDFIMVTPDGYQTMVGELGLNLSVGGRIQSRRCFIED